MPTIKQLNQTISNAQALRSITQILSESSAAKLQRIRFAVLRNRAFTEELSQLFLIVKASIFKKGIQLKIKSKPLACLLLTSNYRFYGLIETKLIRFFLLNITKIQPDLFVAGKTGQNFFRSLGSWKIKSYLFQHDLPDQAEFANLSQELLNYQKVLVFYPRLKSILIQQPAISDITKTPSLSQIKEQQLINHIFEPEIYSILNFFESQIISLLLQQTFLEAELSRTASRLVTMEQAQDKADDFLLEQRKALNEAKRFKANAALLEIIGPLMRVKTD